ncbi:MAG: hypothetical protein OXO48_12660 [Caldilineaceae bacterium]|nr:hypothetical protein [Caldilineaceae bacterium]
MSRRLRGQANGAYSLTAPTFMRRAVMLLKLNAIGVIFTAKRMMDEVGPKNWTTS